jgi:hypothetical protein
MNAPQMACAPGGGKAVRTLLSDLSLMAFAPLHDSAANRQITLCVT